MKGRFILLVFVFISLVCTADEGMWLVHLLREEQMKQMHSMGLKLSSQQIYSEKEASLKDAIVSINGGQCTGSIVSEDGLMLTNFHCAINDVQAISSLENNYLRYGYHSEEGISIPGKTVSFLVKVIDLTDRMVALMKNNSRRKAKFILAKEFSSNCIYEVDIKYMNTEDKYFLFYYQTFKDIRLVYTPPRSLGDFGGDNDNFSWPQYKCDFAVYRIYGDKFGNPASFSPTNVPIKPKYVIPVAKHSPKDGDFTMLLGFPYATSRYLSSCGVQYISKRNDIILNTRESVISFIKQEMIRDESLRLKYSSVFFDYANRYKNVSGENEFIDKYSIVKMKSGGELNDTVLLNKIRICYDSIYKYQSIIDYNKEVFAKGVYLFKYSFSLPVIARSLKRNNDRSFSLIKKLVGLYHKSFENYSCSIDRKIAFLLISTYLQNLDSNIMPFYIHDLCKKYDFDVQLIVDYLFGKTVVLDKNKFLRMISNKDFVSIEKDPISLLALSIIENNRICRKNIIRYKKELLELRREYIALNCYDGRLVYPDANSTMRLTYGRVGGNSISFPYAVSVGGLKERISIDEVNYGSDHDIISNVVSSLSDTLFTSFISDVDIVAGNSGSPVLNADGELVGLAYDGCWESLAGSLYFHPKKNKAVCVDIEYINSFYNLFK